MNILIRNVHSFFQVIESLLPLKFAIVKQRIPHNLVCSLHWQTSIIKHKITPLTPYNPWKTTPHKKTQMWLKNLSDLLEGWSKRHCIIEMIFENQGLTKRCQPHLLSQQAIEKPMLYQLQWLRATLRTTLVDLHRNLPMPFIHRHRLMKNWPKEARPPLFVLCARAKWYSN